MTLLPMSMLAQDTEGTFKRYVLVGNFHIQFELDKDYLTATMLECFADQENSEDRELVIPSTVTVADDDQPALGDPVEIRTYKVIKIADGAVFKDDFITSVIVGDNVEVIGKCAFRGCDGITSVTLGSRVWSIGEQAFAYCTNLATVNVNNMLRSIGTHAFIGCSSLPAFNFPSTVTTIGSKKKTVNRN